MTMNLKLSALAVAALMASAGAMAAAPAQFNTGDSALAFVALDTTGTSSSLFVDLSFKLSEFIPTAALTAPGQTVVWNFNNNSVLVNGVAKSGTFNWSNQLNLFTGYAGADPVRFGVIAGSTGVADVDTFLTTGLPTATQFANVDSSSWGTSNNFWANQNGKGSFPTAGFGASAVTADITAASGAGYVAANFGANGNWRGNSTFSALVPVGQANDFYFMSADPSTIPNARIDGQFTYGAGVLTWQTAAAAPVPEPSAFMMAAAGLAVLAFAGRRRREER